MKFRPLWFMAGLDLEQRRSDLDHIQTSVRDRGVAILEPSQLQENVGAFWGTPEEYKTWSQNPHEHVLMY